MANSKPYHIYLNWQARAPKCSARLHYSDCKHCNFGTGKHDNPSHGENGVWVGPFNDSGFVDKFVRMLDNQVKLERCLFCNP